VATPEKGLLKPNLAFGLAWASEEAVFAIKQNGTALQGASAVDNADYAEYFEWKDGNPNNEDRRGRFVTLENGKIKYANKDTSYLLGIVSATGGLIGNAHELNWQGKYLKDEFGAIIYHEEILEEGMFPETIPTLNPEYDFSQLYTPRSERSEWAVVGLLGQIIMLHDGTCQPDTYCTPGVDGIATASVEKTNCRVMKRIDDTHILVLLK